MLTEHEAKQRWCPFARVGVTEAVSSHACNRTPLSGVEGLNGANLCIGSACMAWRWQAGSFEEHGRLKAKDSVSGYIVDARGYCGLAGKPE